MEESKHVGTHPRLGRGSSLRSENYQKRASQKRLMELEVIKRRTIREMYPLLTSLVSTRVDTKNDPKAKKKNKEHDRRAESLRMLSAQKLSSLHTQAFEHGLHAADPRLHMSSEDLMWLRKYFQEEVGYFNKFFDEIRKGALSAKQVDHRLRMYMAASNATFESGRVVGSSPQSLIYWVVNPVKEHCKICLFLERNSPYTVLNLPTVPGGDACEGYSNCGCRLSYTRADADVLRIVRQRSKTKQQLLFAINMMKRRHAS